MKQHLSFFTLILFSFSLLATPSFAQENGEKERALLPDIKSQNFKIRGEFKARFPGLERQPILGFDPTLRIYHFPPGRMPYMETGDEAVAELKTSQFSRPRGPAYTPLKYNDVHYVFARLGYGSFSSPDAQFWGILPISDKSYLGLDVNYTGSDEGHIANRPSAYRYLTANAEYGMQLSETMDLYVYAGLQNDFNYAADFGPQNNTSNIARIEYEGLHIGATLSGYKNEVTGWKVKGGIRTFTTSYKTDFMPGKMDEMVFNGSFSYRWALNHPGETLTVTASARGGMYEPENTDQQQWSTLYGGLAYERLFNYQTRLYARGRLYYISNFAENKVLPGAKISLSHWFGSRLKLTGRVQAKPFIQTVEQLHEQNRFLGYNTRLRHTYTFRVNGEASLKWYRGSRLYGGVTYLNASNYSYFTPKTTINNTGTNELNYYTVNYRDVTNMKLYAGITHQLAPETFWINVQLYIQNPKLAATDQAVPYSENWGINASATFRPFERVTITGWTKYLGDREPGQPIATKTDFNNIFLVGGRLDIQIIDSIGAYVKVVNLFDQEYQYWQGYIERPLQLYGGLTITF